jgi:hypothetical protein
MDAATRGVHRLRGTMAPESNSTRRAKAGRWIRRRAADAMEPAMRSFYAADPRRAPSLERDLGLNWRSAHGATYRAAWIADTQEVYSVRHSGNAEEAEVRVLGRLAPDVLDRALAGWRRISELGEPGSYEWLVERLRGAIREAAPAF